MNEFTSKMIEEITGLKINTLHYYIESGAIIPDIDLGEGTGKTRKFSETNCMEARLIKMLISHRIPKKIIVGILKKIRENGERERLNPRLLRKKENDEYLIILQNIKDLSFHYRFVSDGGEKYKITWKQWNDRLKLTSFDGFEYIHDFISMWPLIILINFTWIKYSVPMRKPYKLGDKHR